MLRRLAGIFAFLLLAWVFSNASMFGYLSHLLLGQVNILVATQSIESFDDNIDQEQHNKLMLIQQARDFANAELGLSGQSNYRSIYNQNGKPIIYAVTACPQFDLKPKQWNYPIIGAQSYRGYYDLVKAKAEVRELEKLGFDTDIDNVSAYSTLGILSDPVLSSWLTYDSLDLVNLVIHELTHTTLFIPDSTAFNENFAVFVAKQGSLLFAKKLELSDDWLVNLEEKKNRRKQFTSWVKSAALALQELYDSPEFGKLTVAEKLALKRMKIKGQIEKLSDSLSPKVSRLKLRWSEEPPNNTFFTDYLNYRSEQTDFERELNREFGGNLTRMIAAYKSEFGI